MNAIHAGPRVPQGLESFITPELSQDFERWQHTSREGLAARMGGMSDRTFDVSGQRVKAFVIEPKGDFDGRTFAEPFPHPQKWTKGMAVRSLVHAAVTPNSRRVFFPHGKDYYRMSTRQRERMFNGDEKVLPELFVCVLEQLNREKPASSFGIFGESLGSNLGVGMAAVNQDLPITDLIGTEIVSGERGMAGLLGLLSDLGKSTSQDLQRAAVVDSGIPVLRDEIFTSEAIKKDWQKAGLAYLSLTNLAIQVTMLGERKDIVTEALEGNEDLFMVQNSVQDSHITYRGSLGSHDRLSQFEIQSDQRHMLMDNPYAGAVLVVHGLAVNARKRQQRQS